MAKSNSTIKVATFNVSMEALNYLPEGEQPKGDELLKALKSQHSQIKNIAEIIQRVNPDIILLNEFDRGPEGLKSLHLFLDNYLAKSQQDQQPIYFPYFFQGPVNTGITTPFDLRQNNLKNQPSADTYGFGYFPGHFGMLLLSKFPIEEQGIRTFQLFKWKDMPNALETIDPITNKPWYSREAWDNFRLSSKSHWDIPVKVNNQIIHILAAHPTPPVFDGEENRNGKRNHDEIRFWNDYITSGKADYIYDDNGQYGGLAEDTPFIIMGDLNASAVEGDALNDSIDALIHHSIIQDALPESSAGAKHSLDNIHAKNHTANWQMRADYVLPSKAGFDIKSSGVFWPVLENEAYRLVKDRQASSDHRLVWIELTLK